MESKIIKDFGELNLMEIDFPIITVYEKPKDFRLHYVARLFNYDMPMEFVVIAKTIEELRSKKPDYMMIMARSEEDDPIIMESWM